MSAVSILLILLKVLLWFVALVAGVILLALLAVLFVPVSFNVRAEGALRQDDQEDWGGWARWAASVRWGGVLFRMWLHGTEKGVEERSITICGIRLRPRKKGSAPKQKAAAPKKKKAKKRRERPGAGEIRAYIREGIRLVRRLLISLRLHLEGDITFGFDDPSLTGMALGALGAVGKPAGLRVRPDWLFPGLEGWVKARGRIYGYEVAVALWSAYWHSPLGSRLRRRLRFWNRKEKPVQEVEQHGRAG